MMKSILLVLICLLLNACAIDPKLQPWLNNCYASGFYFEDDDIVFVNLPLVADRTYILINRATYRVMVDRDYKSGRPGASAGWSSQVSPGNASALVIDKPQIYFNCTREENNQTLPVNCRQVFFVCQKPLENIHPGSYWLVEDKSLEALWKSIIKRDGQNSSKKVD